MIKKVKKTVPSTYVMEDLNVEEIVIIIYKNELENTSLTEFRIDKVFKKKVDKLYIKWACYDHNKKTLHTRKSKRWVNIFLNCMSVLVEM